jgi:hypothetical protein
MCAADVWMTNHMLLQDPPPITLSAMLDATHKHWFGYLFWLALSMPIALAIFVGHLAELVPAPQRHEPPG